MFKRKIEYEVVPESEHTDFSDREKENPSNNTLLGVSIAATASLSTYAVTRIINTTTVASSPNPTSIPPTIEPLTEPINVLATSNMPAYPMDSFSPEMIPTGFIAESSINMLATVLDPLIQILVAISFPIASVIMVGACFFFMLGNSEKAWQTIFNAGLGYVLIQMSPLFLEILREIGKAV